MEKRFFSVALVLLFFFFISIPVEAQELPPSLPAGFYGTVMVDGAYAEFGTIIVVEVGGEVYSTEVFDFYGESVYNILISGDANLEGSEIYFFLSDTQSNQRNSNWYSGTNSAIDLTFSTEELHKIFFPLILL